MVSRKHSQKLREMRKQEIRRYYKHKQRNVLATPGCHEFILIMDHLKAGFNVAKIFRSAEIFGAQEIHLIGIGEFSVNAAKGAFKTVPAKFHDNFSDCYQSLKDRGYQFFTLEAQCNQQLTDAVLPSRSAFILGNEELGICFDKNTYPEIHCLSIPQFGRIESLNVSIAASVVMYEYVRQHKQS